MWTDNEATVDLLGYHVHADLIREVILDKRLLPVTIGVFGEWGSGKSSLMNILRKSLDSDQQPDETQRKLCEGVAVLHFNGWLFEGYDDAKAALLSSILEELKNHKLVAPALRDRVSSLLKRVNVMRFLRFGFTHVALPAAWSYFTGPGGEEAITTAATAGEQVLPIDETTGQISSGVASILVDDAQKFIKPALPDHVPADVRSFRADFARLLRDSEIKLLVVLIDDLDRCSPERIIDNLEAIKLFLNVENTAFVIGADPRIVRHAIAQRYRDPTQHGTPGGGEDDANERLVIDYLEKLIQIPFSLPRLSRSETETSITLLFCERELTPSDYMKCLTSCGEERAKDRYGAFGFNRVQAALTPQQLSEPLQQALTLCAGVAEMLTEGLNGNPRQVKRFLNAFFLRRKLSQVAKMDAIRDDVLFKLMLLEYSAPKRFQELFGWQSAANGFPNQIVQLEKEATLEDGGKQAPSAEPLPDAWRQPQILRWARMEPKLSTEDLRDYFWLVRDRLGSTLGNLSLVPLHVRRLFTHLMSSGARAAAEQAASLEPGDLDQLHDILEQHILRQPAEKKGYDAFIALLNAGCRSDSRFAALLLKVSRSSIPPATAVALAGLLKAKPNLKPAFGAVIEHFKAGKTSQLSMAFQKNF